LAFDGNNDYVQVSSPDMPTGDFTWLVWAKVSAKKQFQALMMAGNSVGPEVTLNSTNRVVVIHASGQLRSNASIPVASWTHVAVTRSGSSLRIYVNGVQDIVGSTSAASYNFGSCSLLIGVDSDSGCTGALNGYFKGSLDEVRIFNRALSGSEIQQEMSRP
jgi:hypothetical protein